MIDTIISVLREQGIAHYLIHEDTWESAELFFVKKSLDMCREKKITEWSVTVYRDFTAERGGKECAMRGAASFGVKQGMTREELAEAVQKAWNSAAYVKNLYYELVKGGQTAECPKAGREDDGALRTLTAAMAQALFAPDTREHAFVNSAEIFAVYLKKRIVNSEGVDVGYEKRCVKGEFVVQCRNPQDVEMYHSFEYEGADTEALSDKVSKALLLVEQRAQAMKAPKSGTYPVLLANAEVGNLFDYYVTRSASYMIYPKYSSYEVGTKAQGEEITGDRITITLKADEPYSGEGIPMKDRVVLKEGEVQLIHGPSRFGYYLGIEPTGSYEDIMVESGSRSIAELGELAAKKNGVWLEVKSFSDFQMDAMSGHFGGEIRLALLHEGEKITPVTGGSINGSILAVQKDIYLSKERIKSRGYEGPEAVLLTDISVAGSEE